MFGKRKSKGEDMKIQDISAAEETRKLLRSDYPLTRHQKTKIRRAALRKYVEGLYAGEPVTPRNLFDAAGYGQSDLETSRARNFVYQLTRSGQLVRVDVPGGRPTYYWNTEWRRKKSSGRPRKQIEIKETSIVNTDNIEISLDASQISKKSDVSLEEIVDFQHQSKETEVEFDKYNFTVTISHKRSDDLGNHKVGELDMNGVSKATMSLMIDHLIQNLEG